MSAGGTPAGAQVPSTARFDRQCGVLTPPPSPSQSGESEDDDFQTPRRELKRVRHVRLESDEDVPLDVLNLLARLRETRAGVKVIPAEARSRYEQRAGFSLAPDATYLPSDWPPGRANLEPKSDMDWGSASFVCLATLDELNNPRPVWNDVHAAVLVTVIAVWHSPLVALRRTTDVRIDRRYRPEHASASNKMADFSIALEVPYPGVPRHQDLPVRHRLDGLGRHISINHTSWAARSLRYQPIAISIACKEHYETDDEVKTRLGLWAAAQMKKLQDLCAPGSNNHASLEVTLPLVLVRGSEWTVLFARDQGDEIHIIEALAVGKTDTMLGCFKVFAMLRWLLAWSRTAMLPWMMRNTIQLPWP